MRPLSASFWAASAALWLASARLAGAHSIRHGSRSLAEAKEFESTQFNCGTEDRHPDEVRRLALPQGHREVLEKVYNTPHGQHRRRRLADYAVESIEFPSMVFHVIQSSTEGNLTDAQLQSQFDRLNSAFGPHISFASWTRIDHVEASTFQNACNSQATMRAFQQSNFVASALNTYFLDCLSYGLFGYAYFPDSASEDHWIHGTINDYRTIDDPTECSGGCQGDTAVHEWGHAFGLFHTFQSLTDGQCDCTWNDLVEDTPPEYGPHYGGAFDSCSGRNTCSEPGDLQDPITNYMDYSDDVCLSEFTDGQYERMLYQLALYKPNMISASLLGSDQTACVVGSFYNSTTMQCEACGSGTYQDEPSQTSCKACPTDTGSVYYEGTNNGFGTLRIDEKQCYTIDTSFCIDHWLADQYCDEVNNNAECFYDGGDCCETCCTSNPDNPYTDSVCGSGDQGHDLYQECLDPSCASSAVPDHINRVPPSGSDQCFNFRITESPTPGPTLLSASPSAAPTISPSAAPVPLPSDPPTPAPVPAPSAAPTPIASEMPSNGPTAAPVPTSSPSSAPTTEAQGRSDDGGDDGLLGLGVGSTAMEIGVVVGVVVIVGGMLMTLAMCLLRKQKPPQGFQNQRPRGY